MELANVMLALGGDRTTSIPKYNVTPAEIAVLTAIHGSDAVFDIEPTGESVKRSNREERDRLIRLYPAMDEDRRSIVLNVYPGTSPVMHTALEELGLDDMLFKPTEHAKPAAPKKASKKAAAAKPEPISAPADDTDAIFGEEPENVLE